MDSDGRVAVAVASIVALVVVCFVVATVIWSNTAGGCRSKCAERFSSLQETGPALQCIQACAAAEKGSK